ncbi:hypothetical protein GWI33_013545 [Rhynchophorus ferrugineus]|uniref:Uncharacterized protein n=1 Tax=Rhynchophorus ferrugineus TaxID=354439 RepID=A0A834MD56_RHYFE|nr:hypothetical protein GWI33_013545 [Rhynchophorus ferrugineus]
MDFVWSCAVALGSRRVECRCRFEVEGDSESVDESVEVRTRLIAARSGLSAGKHFGLEAFKRFPQLQGSQKTQNLKA